MRSRYDMHLEAQHIIRDHFGSALEDFANMQKHRSCNIELLIYHSQYGSDDMRSRAAKSIADLQEQIKHDRP